MIVKNKLKYLSFFLFLCFVTSIFYAIQWQLEPVMYGVDYVYDINTKSYEEHIIIRFEKDKTVFASEKVDYKDNEELNKLFNCNHKSYGLFFIDNFDNNNKRIYYLQIAWINRI